MYHYTECGLENVHLKNGYVVSEIEGEECVGVHDVKGLHRTIGHCLVEKNEPLEPKEFKFLRVELGQSQTNLGELIDCDGQTIARYEKGQTRIPKTVDALLRAIYLEFLDEESNVHHLLQLIKKIDGEKKMARYELAENAGRWEDCDILDVG